MFNILRKRKENKVENQIEIICNDIGNCCNEIEELCNHMSEVINNYLDEVGYTETKNEMEDK